MQSASAGAGCHLLWCPAAPAGPVGTQVPVQCWLQGHSAHPCCRGGVWDHGSAGPDRPQNQAKEEGEGCLMTVMFIWRAAWEFCIKIVDEKTHVWCLHLQSPLTMCLLLAYLLAFSRKTCEPFSHNAVTAAGRWWVSVGVECAWLGMKRANALCCRSSLSRATRLLWPGSRLKSWYV